MFVSLRVPSVCPVFPHNVHLCIPYFSSRLSVYKSPNLSLPYTHSQCNDLPSNGLITEDLGLPYGVPHCGVTVTW